MASRQRWSYGTTIGLLGAAAVAAGSGPAAAQSGTDGSDPLPPVPRLTPAPSGSAAPASTAKKPAPRAKATGGRRTHRITAGESMWSIARERLGADASDAQVLKYLVRVWNLNAKRMGAVDPDLIPVNVTITLPPLKRAS